jgi:hypothetical protein
VAPATAGGAAPPPPAEAEFDADVGSAVVGDLGWALGPDLDTAVAIAADPSAGIWRMRRRSGRFWWVRGSGADLGHLVEGLRRIWWDFGAFLDRSVGSGFCFWV